jgi:K+/H+ antiporter YhaU regulatory subunit KhtT
LQVSTAQRFLHQVHGAGPSSSTFDESELGTVVVPDHSPKVGRSLSELEVFRSSGIQILAVDRSGDVTLNPSANEIIRAGDSLLVLGTAAQIREFFAWLDN